MIETKPIPLDAIPDKDLVRLLAYWNDKRGDRPMPSRRDIDPADIRWMLGRISLFDIEPGEPTRFRYRLQGTQIGQDDGFDLTGRTTDELEPPEYAAMLHEHLSQVHRTGSPNCYGIQVVFTKVEFDYYRLALPLAAHGETPGMILTGAGYGQETVKRARELQRPASPRRSGG